MVQGEARQLPQAIADLAGQVAEAADRIRQSVTETPVEQITELAFGVDVIFKLENLQQTGSFKLRGASNKILSLSAEEASRGHQQDSFSHVRAGSAGHNCRFQRQSRIGSGRGGTARRHFR